MHYTRKYEGSTEENYTAAMADVLEYLSTKQLAAIKELAVQCKNDPLVDTLRCVNFVGMITGISGHWPRIALWSLLRSHYERTDIAPLAIAQLCWYEIKTTEAARGKN